mgnify:FL=1
METLFPDFVLFGNIKWMKMITLIKNAIWMYPWETHVLERGFEGCKWLGRFNATRDI